ncbi:MAG: hypothetical protein J6O41_04380 [Clostridia bacterium]|nr:hypothetical protein [Clostridia bacterium]
MYTRRNDNLNLNIPYRSAGSHYSYMNCKENSGILRKLENTFKGYIEIPLNLNDFISYNRLDMILNNDLISNNEFEFYNYDEMVNADIIAITEEVKDDLNNNTDYYLTEIVEYYSSYTMEEIQDLPTTEAVELLEDAIYDYCDDHIYESYEIYQYFIIPEQDVEYWTKYTNYPVLYFYDLDLYQVGITHWGMSWDYFSTQYIYRHYL